MTNTINATYAQRHDGKVGCNTVEYTMAFLYSVWLYFLWHGIKASMYCSVLVSSAHVHDKNRGSIVRFLFNICSFLVQLLATCCSAALHRRHLMVWKIFAPRFVFEGVSFLMTTAVLFASFLVVLRIDQALRSWFKKLETSDELKPKNR